MSTDSHDLGVDEPSSLDVTSRSPGDAPIRLDDRPGDRPDDRPDDRPGEVSLGDPPPLRRADSPADRFMRRLLRLPLDGPHGGADEARKAFQTSIAVATVRCLLMYIVFPFVLPAVGVASGVGPALGLAISVVAITAITLSIRRFWRADHSKRWHYTVLGTVVIGFMMYLVVRDIISLAT